MGQQQLLLIVLGVIVVGIAVVVGINLFQANAESSAQDSAVSQATNIGALAQQFYKKPTAMGGGQNTFTGFTIPADLASTADVVWTPSVSAQTVTLTGNPVASTGYTFVVTTTITPTGIKSVVTPGT